MLLSLIVLGSAVALSALVSLIFAALYSSYLLPCGLLLWRRCTGAIQPALSNESVLSSGRVTWGPWKLAEPLGAANNLFACVYLTFILFWSFWPQITPTTLATTNWSILVYGAVVLFSVFWYVVRARHYFKGPVKEI
jgi:choline transport protein